MALVVSPNLSVIVSVWMEALFYGMNFLTYCLCMYIFINRRSPSTRKTTLGLSIISTLLFLVSSAHVSVNLRRLIEGYVNPPTKAAMTTYLLDITQPTNIAKQFLVVIADLLSNTLIIWRVYTVWERNRMICIPPTLLALGVLVSGLGAASFEAQVTPGQNIFASRISAWGKAQFSFSLATNVLSTLLIASRIIYATSTIRTLDPSSSSGRRYWKLVVLIVESASFAAVAQTLELAFYASDFPGIFFIADSIVQIVSMTPLSIIVFIGLTQPRGRSYGTTFGTDTESRSDPRHRGKISAIQFTDFRKTRASQTMGTANTMGTDMGTDMDIELDEMDIRNKSRSKPSLSMDGRSTNTQMPFVEFTEEA